MVVTEALARGLPVLATDVGGVPEALGATRTGGVPGLLVPAGDVAGAGRRAAALAGRRRPAAAACAPRRRPPGG